MAAHALEEGSKEIELKLEFDPADAARLKAHSLLAAAAPREQALISTYYDTGDFALRREGVYLRVRDLGTRYVQTIKATRSDAELLERDEWERELAGREPDLDAAEGTALAPLLTEEVRASLRPQFLTRVRRTIHRVEQDGSEVEVDIDEGEVVSSARQAPISEVELELKRGDPAVLFRLARVLAATVPLRLAVKTKAERGFELVEGEPAAVEKSRAVDIPPDMPSSEAFKAIARECLRQVIVNEPAMCGGDAEALHQMRIGLRRLRAAIWLFADVVADDDRNRLKAELRWIARELGRARDLDVFAVEMLEPLRVAHPEDADVAAAHRDFGAKRAEAYASAAGSVRSDRFRNALLDVAEWIELGCWTRADDAERQALGLRPAAEHASKELRRLRKRIRDKGANLRALATAQRHRLRIRAKRLRYATEFFAATFPGGAQTKRREKMLAALKDLQEALGALNDLEMRHSLIEDHAEAGGPRRGLSGIEADRKKLLSAAERAYARFAKTKPFWKA